MTETVFVNSQWRQNSGHYLDYDDYDPFFTNGFNDDFSLQSDSMLMDFDFMYGNPEAEAEYYEDEDVMADGQDTSLVSEESVTNVPQYSAPALELQSVTKTNQNQLSAEEMMQMQNYLAFQQQLAIGLAQNYYGYSRLPKQVIQDRDISSSVYAKLALKDDKPFEHVPRVFNEEHEDIVRPKKRVKKTVDLPEPKYFNDFAKYKDALNALDSLSFETYITEVKRCVVLSPSEKEEIKTIRSRIKNREAARKSRLKKKSKPQVLEDTVRELMDQTKELEKEVVDLQQERVDLYNETSFLTNMISGLIGNNKEFTELYKSFYETLQGRTN
eukprot:TRINITY_DN1291_c0_g1_i1.p1 TRINITY_DN1291_c0_g1~~TRINITY_DN1291_c0_g1_i1.p1  ORF type:complete len:328 (-),score=88.92 TRINITY_DN1291_c0_g1_i1:365-1348(-)